MYVFLILIGLKAKTHFVSLRLNTKLKHAAQIFKTWKLLNYAFKFNLKFLLQMIELQTLYERLI